MIILGIDPGTASIGYALLKCKRQSAPCLLTAGLIALSNTKPEDKLLELHRRLCVIIKKWKPEVMALERLFFAKNTKTALAVAEARGVILLTAKIAGLILYEYTPLEAKKVLTGDGKADKLQVQKMVKLTLPGSRTLAARDDVYDAIALAIACYFKDLKGRSQEI